MHEEDDQSIKTEPIFFNHRQNPNGEVELQFFIPGLQPPKKTFGPKYGEKPLVCLTYFTGGLSLEMTADVKEKDPKTKKEIVRRYKRVIRRFPSAIDINRCEYEIKKGKVEVLLRKKENIDWQPFIDAGGLDQLGSREPSPDTIEGAAALAEPKPTIITPEELLAGFETTYEVDTPDPDSQGGRQVTRVTTRFTRLAEREHSQRTEREGGSTEIKSKARTSGQER